MPISDKEIIDVTPSVLGRTENMYVPAILQGLGTTLRHLFQNVGRDGKTKKNIWVIQYPEERREQRPVEEGGLSAGNFRGVHRLNRDEDDRVRCVACFSFSPVRSSSRTAIELSNPWPRTAPHSNTR